MARKSTVIVTRLIAIGRNTRRDFVAGGGTQAVTQYSYDAANRLECAALRMNPGVFGSLPGACALSTQGAHGPDRISRNTYTNADEIASVTSGYATPSPIVEAASTYSANGLRASLADGAGNVSVFVYDGHDRLSRLRYPNASGGGTSTADYEEYSYDAAGNVTQTRRRDGQLIGASYDGLGRVTLMDAPGTGNDVTYAYDNFSRQTAAGSLTFAYDQLSRLTSAVAAQGSVSYLYDAASRRTRMTWPDGFYVTYDYDLTNAMTAVRENGAAAGAGVLAAFTYDNLGRRVALTRGNGAVTNYAYDTASRLQTLTQDLPGTSYDQTYGLSYNAASQVTQRSGSNAAYDLSAPANGNIAYADNGLNQYTSVAGATPSYDARGNLTGYGGATYAYDIFNRLISATPASGAAASLSYDSAGRLAQVAGASTTRFLYDGADMIAEYNSSNALQRRTVHGPGVDEPLVWYEGAGTADRRYLITDQLGSIVAANGDTITVNAYDEYGQPAAANTGRFQYTGQMWLGEAQLYHYKARAYHPGLGRFNQSDPIGFGGGMNLYAYVGNDPVNFIDPWGLQESPLPGCHLDACPSDDGGVVVTACPTNSICSAFWIERFLENLIGPVAPSVAESAFRSVGHDYTVTNKVCNAALGPAAQAEALGSAAYPGQNPNSQVQSGQFYIVIDPRNGLPGGIVRSTVRDGGYSVTNVTTPLHVFAGRVDRTIFANATGTYVTTHGVGTSPGIILPPPMGVNIPGPVLDAINQSQGPELFNAVDGALAERLAESNPAC